MSRIQKIIDSTKKTMRGQFATSSFTPTPMRIWKFDDYHRVKVAQEGKESPSLAELREFHEKTKTPTPRVISKPWKYTEGEWDHVFVSLNVTRGRVRISLSQPFVELYNNYQSKAKQPPVEERVRLMKQARYPEELLLKLIRKDQKLKNDSEKNKQFLEKIFGRNK